MVLYMKKGGIQKIFLFDLFVTLNITDFYIKPLSVTR